jgi:hypothetical protein
MAAEISMTGAARFGLMLSAVNSGDLAQAAEMLISIPRADIDGIKARLAEFGFEVTDLVRTLNPEAMV